MMADLQAEIEFTVELRKFINIDLFVQGYYQIRTGVKCSPKFQSTTKVEVKSEFPCSIEDANEQIYPACVFNEWGVSKTFLIIYKNEQVHLDDQVNFKVSVILDAQNLTECFNRMEFQLLLELYFTEKDYSPEKMATMQQLCSRSYKLHFNPRSGIHTHVPVLFDYFHLSAITTTVHASLLCLIPPSVSDRSNVRRTSLFSFLFGQDLAQITTDQVNPTLLDRAYQLHNLICEILLAAYESLQDFYEKMLEHLSADEEKPSHVHQKCRQKLRSLCEKLKALDDIHTIDNLAHAHIAQCSAENIMLWCQFIQVFGLHESTSVVLAKEYHLKRVKRFSEGFFLRETSRVNLLTNESENYNDCHELVRSSLYYSRLPHLPIECPELDGIPDTLPILIEEIYSPTDEQNSASASTSPAYDKSLIETVQNLNKVPLGLTPRAQLGKTAVTSPKSTKKPSTSRPNTASNSPIVSPSARTLLPFRKQTEKSVNPVVAISNDPSVRLMSFRKMNDDSSTNTTSTTVKSDSDFNVQGLQRPKSSQLTKVSSRHSLPDVPLQRSNSYSQLEDLSTVSSFLCSTTEKTDDEVFARANEDTTSSAASSAFADSSVKSKALQSSFRGKRGTINRRAVSFSSRSLSMSSAHNLTHEKRSITNAPVYTTSNDDPNSSVTASDPTETRPLDSVLNATLELEHQAMENLHQHRPISTDQVDPLMLNGLTDEENQLNMLENNDEQDHEASSSTEKKSSWHQDRIQHQSNINSQTIDFVVQKEKLKQLIHSKYSSNLMFYSDLSSPISTIPYFCEDLVPLDLHGVHLIICVHGLDGNSGDLRLVKTYLELCLPECRLEFLMSSSNHSSTFDDIDIMVKQLLDEIDTHIDRYNLKPQRISFIGHSLGNLIIRATVGHQRFERYRPLLYTYFSLSGPHLGTLFNTSGLVNMGMWLMQKWKKSCSLSQMSFRDHVDPKQTYLYQLSKKPCLEFFKNILLIASPQDRYVPFHSARIEVCKAALKDTVYGSIYVEMINNLLTPILRNPSITFVRYNAFHNIPSGTNTLIGRAAHIAILDLELFVEKLILVSAAKYFK